MLADQDSVGTRVAKLRKARGLTQRGLAMRANVSYSLVTKVESGDRQASPVFIGAVTRALHVDLADVTGIEEYPRYFPILDASAVSRHRKHARELLCYQTGNDGQVAELLRKLARDPDVSPWLLIEQLISPGMHEPAFSGEPCAKVWERSHDR